MRKGLRSLSSGQKMNRVNFFPDSIDEGYRHHKGLFPCTETFLGLLTTDRLIRLICLQYPQYQINRVPRYNRQINKSFKPYMFSDYTIKYKEGYASDFRVVVDGKITFTDTVGIYMLAKELEVMDISYYFNSWQKPNDEDHRDALLKSSRHLGFKLPRLARRFQVIVQDGVIIKYITIDNFRKRVDRGDRYFHNPFMKIGRKLVVDILVDSDFKEIIMYDMLYLDKDISHLPYEERLKILADFRKQYAKELYFISLPSFIPNLYEEFQASTDEQYLVLDKAAYYKAQKGRYKIKKKVTLPFIVLKIKKRKVRNQDKFIYLGMELGGYNAEGNLVRFFHWDKLDDFRKPMQKKLTDNEPFYIGQVLYFEFDEFYGDTQFNNMRRCSNFFRRRSIKREICNVYLYNYY